MLGPMPANIADRLPPTHPVTHGPARLKLCSTPTLTQRGARNPKWRGGQFTSMVETRVRGVRGRAQACPADGYIYVLRPDHPNA